MSDPKPWTQPMPEEQFEFMREVLAAPSPVGLEAGMTWGVIRPRWESFMLPTWKIHAFRANAGLVLDTAPGRDDLLTVMFMGHADKIRLQVRTISEDGKVWLSSDSFLPCTLLGHKVVIFSEDPKNPGSYRTLRGPTVEALGAIHFASPDVRSGAKGIKAEQLYLELLVHGSDKKKQVEALGLRPGDTILLDRPIERGFMPDTFLGAYLDDGLGCFVVAELARLVAERGGLSNVRVLFAVTTHEEVDRLGARVVARTFQPDVLVAVDVDHDYVAAPGVKDRNFPPLEMGKGFTLGVGSVVSETLNSLVQKVALNAEIPCQRDVLGRDTGTDTMSAPMTGTDAAATTIGFPVRNMHTISESAHTGDVLAALHVMDRLLDRMEETGITAEYFRAGHPRLDRAEKLER